MRGISLFSGAGGMDVGFEAAGVRTVLACERDRHAAATHRLNFGCEMHEGDVRDLVARLRPGQADVVFGGPPCQGYSVAGKMDPQDPRSMLVHSFLEAVGAVRPVAFVMENVDALATLAKWSGTLADIRASAEAMGYETHVAVLNAAEFGVPQKRKRMFMWGVPANGGGISAAVEASLAASRRPEVSCAEVFRRLGPAGTERNPLTSPARITYARNPVLRASSYAGMLLNGAGRPVDPRRPSPTIAASAGGNKTHVLDEAAFLSGAEPALESYHRGLLRGGAAREGLVPAGLRRLTIAESAALQTFPAAHRFSGPKSAVYRQVGNAVPCLLAEAVAVAAVAAVSCGVRAAA